MRCQFLGSYPESERRAFLFTNVHGAKGEKYYIPVVVGALAAIKRNLCHGHGRAVSKLADVWINGIAKPRDANPRGGRACHEVIISGEELTRPAAGLIVFPSRSLHRASTLHPT